MFDDFIRGFREYVSDRFLSPLGSSLTVSWCLWNYKALIVILSGESAIRKIHLLHLVYQDLGYSILHLALGPLVTAAFYIYVFPYPSNWVYSYSLRRRKEGLRVKREIEDQTVLTQEESRALRRQFEEMDLEHTSAALRLNTRIDALKDQVKQLTDERDGLLRALADAQVTSIDPSIEPNGTPMESIELGKIHWRVLDALGREGKDVLLSTLSKTLLLGEAGIWLILGELEEFGLVYREDEDNELGLPRYAGLTEDGLRTFMNNVG